MSSCPFLLKVLPENYSYFISTLKSSSGVWHFRTLLVNLERILYRIEFYRNN